MEVDIAAGSSATVPALKSSRTSAQADYEDISIDGATPVARSSATAPLLSSPESKHAFTLDISSDNKKVKLYLNKSLIIQKLQEKRLDTMNRNKAVLKRQVRSED